MGSGSSFAVMKCCQHFSNLRGSRTNWRYQRFLVMSLVEVMPLLIVGNHLWHPTTRL
jgi:hypothetical protein